MSHIAEQRDNIPGHQWRRNNRNQILWLGGSNSVRYLNRSKGSCTWTKVPHGIIEDGEHLHPILTVFFPTLHQIPQIAPECKYLDTILRQLNS
eukprot:492637-Ditylum_brightwellii.AAC.1